MMTVVGIELRGFAISKQLSVPQSDCSDFHKKTDHTYLKCVTSEGVEVREEPADASTNLHWINGNASIFSSCISDKR